MSETQKTIEVRRSADRVDVVLNRPQVRNAFDAVLISELTKTFASLSADPDVRVVVLSGEGKVFSAGADVNWMKDSIDLTPEQNKEDAFRMSEMFRTISEAPFPVIVRAHGAAIGGGTGLVCAGDITVAAQSCVFSFSEVRLGIIPAVISPYAIHKIGAGEARRWFLTGERFDAQTAHRIGMIHEVCDDDKLDETIAHIIDAILAGGPEAVSAAKSLIREVDALDSIEQLQSLTSLRISERRATAEAQGGLRAFLEKTTPPWMTTGSDNAEER